MHFEGNADIKRSFGGFSEKLIMHSYNNRMGYPGDKIEAKRKVTF